VELPGNSELFPYVNPESAVQRRILFFLGNIPSCTRCYSK
jgi:hypothetical protein